MGFGFGWCDWARHGQTASTATPQAAPQALVGAQHCEGGKGPSVEATPNQEWAGRGEGREGRAGQYWNGCTPYRGSQGVSHPWNPPPPQTKVTIVGKKGIYKRESLFGLFLAQHDLWYTNHLEERLLDQAQARASYTPPFWGAIRVAYPRA